MPAQARQIALIVSAAQLGANRALIDGFAASVVADLTKRAGVSGPKHSAVVIEAASSTLAVREQLKGRSAALLIGDVAVPQRHGSPYLDPYRVPSCDR